MKVAISSNGENLSDEVSEVFARCPYFILVDIEGGKIIKSEALKNKAGFQMSGVGVYTSKFLAEKKVETVIAKNIGPRAFDLLKQFNIEIYQAEGKIEEALDKFSRGQLERL